MLSGEGPLLRGQVGVPFRKGVLCPAWSWRCTLGADLVVGGIWGLGCFPAGLFEGGGADCWGRGNFTESQSGRGWKGPLWVTQSNPLLKQGHPEQGAQDLVRAGLEYLQRRRLHSLPGQKGP